jgi:hypothetical protein
MLRRVSNGVSVKVGGLSCTMSPTIGLLVVEEQAVNCQFTPHGHYPSERYTGTIGTVGIAVGVIGGRMLAWGVYMPTQGPSQGSLAGTYGGAEPRGRAVLSKCRTTCIMLRLRATVQGKPILSSTRSARRLSGRVCA